MVHQYSTKSGTEASSSVQTRKLWCHCQCPGLAVSGLLSIVVYWASAQSLLGKDSECLCRSWSRLNRAGHKALTYVWFLFTAFNNLPSSIQGSRSDLCGELLYSSEASTPYKPASRWHLKQIYVRGHGLFVNNQNSTTQEGDKHNPSIKHTRCSAGEKPVNHSHRSPQTWYPLPLDEPPMA